MENYYLAEILRLEDHPEEAHSPYLLREERVTLEESKKWAESRFSLFQDALEETCFLPNMQLGYANSCLDEKYHLTSPFPSVKFENFGTSIKVGVVCVDVGDSP